MGQQVPPSVLARGTIVLAAFLSHEIQVVRGQERVLEHLITHEISHIVRLHRVPEAERLAPAIPPETRQHAAERVLPTLTRLAQRGLPADTIVALFDQWYENLVTQLANFPADLRIEQWLHDRFPGLRSIQRRSLTHEVERGYPAFHPVVQEQTPAAFYYPTLVMNAAQAFQVAELTRTPHLAAPYEARGYGPAGRHLLRLAFSPTDEGHASDMAAVNAWAQELQLTGWYSWWPFHTSR